MATKKPGKPAKAKSRATIKDLEPNDAKHVKGGDTKPATTTSRQGPGTIELQSFSFGSS